MFHRLHPVLLPLVFLWLSCSDDTVHREGSSPRIGCTSTSCPDGYYCHAQSGSCMPRATSATPAQEEASEPSSDHTAQPDPADAAEPTADQDQQPAPLPATTPCTCGDPEVEPCGHCEGRCPGICMLETMSCQQAESAYAGTLSFRCVSTTEPTPPPPGPHDPVCTSNCAGKTCGADDGCEGTCGAPTDDGCPLAGATTLADFEVFGSWSIGDQANGTFSRATDQFHGGATSAALAYSFPTAANDFVVFRQDSRETIPDSTTKLSAWVYGDGKGFFFNLWVLDSTGTAWSIPLGRTDHNGWKRLENTLVIHAWPGGHIFGTGTAISKPLRLYGVVLDDAPDSFTGNGTIYLDDLQALP